MDERHDDRKEKKRKVGKTQAEGFDEYRNVYRIFEGSMGKQGPRFHW